MIEKLQNQKNDLEFMNQIKKKKFKKAFLQLIVIDENSKEEMAVFELSKALGKRTLLKDIEEDKKRIEKVEKLIDQENKKQTKK